MKLYKFTPWVLGAVMMASLGACSDSDDWTPGPEDNNVGVSAYFITPSETSFIFGSDFDPNDIVINVAVKRQATENAATVGLSLKADTDGFSIPQNVEFAAGEEETSFEIDCAGIPNGTHYKVAVTLAEDQTDIYGIGLQTVEYTVIKADWKLLSDNVTYKYRYYSGTEIYPSTVANMYQLEGTKTFKMEDFFGSGLDITFECDTPSSTFLMPLQNANFDDVDDYDKEDNGWYLFDEKNSDWPEWTPGNLEGYSPISYLLFYANSSDTVLRMISNSSKMTGYLSATTWVDLADGSSFWGSFRADFTLLYNPFE